jgi:FdhD protein
VEAAQRTHQLTGALHAAATIYNQQLHLFEDVGRHNALDKLIGWQLRHKTDVDCVLMTSRLSIELVQKSIRGRIPWLIGMSAPTSTAIRVAERYGLGVAGFLRNDRVTYYSGYLDV